MTDTGTSFPSLTPREQQCLTYLSMGLRVNAVAEAMGTDSQMIEKQITSVRAKLRADTREQAVAIARHHNLLS